MFLVSDLRFIEREDPVSGKVLRILQCKKSLAHIDDSGNFCLSHEDSTWYDVRLEFPTTEESENTQEDPYKES